MKQLNADDKGNVKSVSLSDGRELDADLVIVATGVRPNTEYLKQTGIEMNRDGGIVCDPFLQTSIKDVYAAGDIASYPYWPTGSRTRTEHWITALDMGTNAAFNMMDKYVPYDTIPFFWTRHYNKSLQFIGTNAVGYKEVVIKGKMNKCKFMAFYVDEADRIVAVAGMGKPRKMLMLFEAMQQNVLPTGSEIKSGRVKVKDIKDRLKQNVGAGRCKRANCC